MSALSRYWQPILAGALSVLAVWSHWPTLASAGRRWLVDPQYSHGYLVPCFALVLLWLRSPSGGPFPDARPRPIIWPLLVACTLRSVNLLTYNLDWLDGAVFVLSLLGACAAVGGRSSLLRMAPALGFLLFMLPLPYRVERWLGEPLQGIATAGSTFLLQLLGLAARAEGNVIVVGADRIGVAEACNGLSMLLVFIALAVAFALVVRRPLFDRLILVGSALPIAILVNITRITVTGALQAWGKHETAELVFHDLAGWLMMPLALAFLWVEMKFLSYVLVEDKPGPVPTPHDSVIVSGLGAGS